MDIAQTHADPTINVVMDVLKKGKQAIIFVNTKNSAEKTAEDIAKKIKEKKGLDLAQDAKKALSSPTKQCERLAFCLQKEIAFHHAGLAQKQKEIIEDNFRSKRVKVIAATPTLAAGLDLPAYRVILKDLRRFSQRGLQYIPVLEYLQMAGRAGRPKYDSLGESVIIATTPEQKEELTNRYLYGQPENIYSKLAVEPVLRTYVLSLIASKFVSTRKQIIDFFSKTFWAKQYGDMTELEGIIDNVLGMLEEWEFLQSSKKDDFVSAADLQNEQYRATILGKRVAELYIDPYTAHYFVEMIPRSTQPKPFALLHLLSSTLEIRPRLKTKAKEFEKIQDALVAHGDDLLDKEPSIYDEEYTEFQNAIKTASFFYEWIDEKNEEFLLEEFSIRPGEIRVKLDIADWLLFCLEELTRILQFPKTITEIKKLRMRLKYGVREDIIPLLRLKQVGRVRARKMYTNGIKDLGDVKTVDASTLAQLVGKAAAIEIKKQVGQEVVEIKENKRKGQINLNDFTK